MNCTKIISSALLLIGVSFSNAYTQDSVPKDSLKAIAKQPKLMPSIEIKAVRAGKDYPFTHYIIQKATIEKNNLGQDIPLLLNQLPAAVANSDAGNGFGYTGIRIRGTDPARINFTLNGIAYNDAESQGVFLVNLPDILSSTNSIQIQRGVGTSSNGTGAFGATVNLLTNEVNQEAYGQISNSLGSFQSRKHTIKAGTGLIKGQYSVDVRLSSLSSEGYIDRATSDLQSFYVSAANIKASSSLRMNIFSGKEKTYQAWYGVPEDKLTTDRTYNQAGMEKPDSPYDNETDNYTQTHYQLFYNKVLNPSWNLSVATFATTGAGYYEQYKAAEPYEKYGLTAPRFNGAVLTGTDLVRQLWLDNIYYGGNFSFQQNKEHQELIWGGGTNLYQGQHFGKIIWAANGIPKDKKWYDHDASKMEQHLFGKWLGKMGKWKLFADLQLRSVAYQIDGFRDNPDLKIDQNWFFANPKIGARYTRNNFSAFLSYAMANKEPNRDDFEAGANTQPQHETLHDIESGFETNLGKLNLVTTVYGMFYVNQLVLTGKVNDVGAYTRTNIRNSYRAGVELEANLTLTSKFKISNNLALSQNKIKSFTDYYDDYDAGDQVATLYRNTNLSFSPAIVNNALFSYSAWKNGEFRLLSKYVSRQYLDNTSRKDRSLAPYFTQDLHYTHDISLKKIKSIALFVQVNNLWNIRYSPNGYTYTYRFGGEISRNNFYFPMAGVNFMTGCTINL